MLSGVVERVTDYAEFIKVVNIDKRFTINTINILAILKILIAVYLNAIISHFSSQIININFAEALFQ